MSINNALDRANIKALLKQEDVQFKEFNFRISDHLSGLRNDQWVNYIQSGLIVKVQKREDGKVALIGKDNNSQENEIGYLTSLLEDDYSFGVVLPVHVSRNEISPNQSVLLLNADRIPEKILNSSVFKTIAKKNQLDQFADGVGSVGKALIPLTVIAIIFLIFISTCV